MDLPNDVVDMRLVKLYPTDPIGEKGPPLFVKDADKMQEKAIEAMLKAYGVVPSRHENTEVHKSSCVKLSTKKRARRELNQKPPGMMLTRLMFGIHRPWMANLIQKRRQKFEAFEGGVEHLVDGNKIGGMQMRYQKNANKLRSYLIALYRPKYERLMWEKIDREL